jgi:hypothetical protein
VAKAAAGAEILRAGHSAVFLPEKSPFRRHPRAPNRARPPEFTAGFEDRALFYDCFWNADGDSIVLAGPPPLNLMPVLERARYLAEPSGKHLTPSFSVSRSTATVEFRDAPKDTRSVSLHVGGNVHKTPVQPNLADRFARTRCLSTMNKDNDLDWIALWADWHARLHGADAILMFDNGSTRYGIDDLERTLAAVPGMKTVAVLSWPYRYGTLDRGVLFHRHWANFIQVAGLMVWIRRFGAKAEGLMNCDIDELVGTNNGRSAFDIVKQSPDGFVSLRGQWVESVARSGDGHHHFAYRYRHSSPLKALCANKWLLDPKRDWVRGSGIVPMMHRIYGMPGEMPERAPRLPFWHFRGISTNWKDERRIEGAVNPVLHKRLDALDAAIARYRKAGGEAG